MYTPELSIIVYAHCAESFVGETLKSICEQSFQEWECIVVDDGSRDRTASLVEKFVERDSRFTLIRQSFGGVSRARNRGFLESRPTTAYVSFIDAGDVWVPRALEEMIAQLRQNKDAVGAHGVADNPAMRSSPLDRSVEESIRRSRLEYRNGVFRELTPIESTSFATLICEDILSPTGVLLGRRSSYETAGLYDPKIQGDEQWDMGFRLSRIGPIQYLPRVVLYSPRLNQSWVDRKECGLGIRRGRGRFFSSRRNSANELAIVDEGWRAFRWIRIKECFRGIFQSCAKGALVDALRGIWVLARYSRDYLAGHPLSG
jgi:glycosyltransferase involved in cell wall biosynthesis